MPPDRRLRILLVAPETTGGIGGHVRTLAAGLVARGHLVTVCAPGTSLTRFDLAATGAQTVALPMGTLPAVARSAHKLRALAADHDVTHAHGVRAGAHCALVGATPLAVTWHNAPLGSAPRRAVHRLLERICARRAAVVLGASPDLVARARSAGASRAGLCAVATPMPPVAPGDPARPLGTPPTVLAIARLHRQKRLDLLIDAAARWPAGPQRPRVLIVGDGPLAETLAARVRRTGAPVSFLGRRDDVAELLVEADLVVLPSDWEARPLVAQEAMRAGVPLVATDVGGVADLVGDAALLVPPGDAAALAAGIERVLADDRLRTRLRRTGPRLAANWPSVDAMVDELALIYLDLTSR